jgi:iron complex outermembrane receptor protein
MLNFIRGASCAALIGVTVTIPSPSNADSLRLTVPIGQEGSLTNNGVQAAVEDIKNIPGGAGVVPAEEFQKTYALSMKDMLAKTPGVFAEQRWSEESRLSIRGSGLSRGFHLRGITLLQDGIPFNFADGSGDFQEIDPLTLQHIEVYRGGQGLRYGAATLGGAVNMVTPTAHTTGYNGLLRIEGGSFETARMHAQASQVFSGADVFAAATRSIGDGYREQSESNTERLSGNAGIQLGDSAETRFYVSWNNIKQDVPGTLSKDDALHDPEIAPDINVENDYSRDIRSLRLANRTVLEFDNGWNLEVGGYVNDKFLYHPIFQVIDQNSLDIGGFTRLKGKYALGDHKNDFMLGLNIGQGRNRADRYVNAGGKRGSKTADAKQMAENMQIYGENRFYLTPEWSFIAGLQGTVSARDYDDHLNGANNDDKIYRSLNPKIGAMWNVTPQSEIFASITRSSEPPTFSELVQLPVTGFVPLEDQKAWTAEIGTRGREGAFSWDATLYHARVRDELLQFATGPDIPASIFNADKTIHQGLELGAGWQVTDKISFGLIYNFNDFRFDDDVQFDNNELAGAPPHQFRLSARYERNGAFVEPSIDYIPEAPYVDFANTMKADSYAVFGVKAGWDITENVMIFLDARNLTDKRHITSFSTVSDARTAANLNVFYPGEGRSLYGGVEVKF